MHPPGRKLVTLHTPALLNASAWPTSAAVSSHDGVLGLSQGGPLGSDLSKRKKTKCGVIGQDEPVEHVATPLKKTMPNPHTKAPMEQRTTKAVLRSSASAGNADDEHSGSGHTKKLRPRRNVKAPGTETATNSPLIQSLSTG